MKNPVCYTRPEKESKIMPRVIWGMWFVCVVVILGVWIGGIYVAWHFITKFW